MKVILDLHYMPSIEYFIILAHADEVWIEAHEHFQKQSYRNRCFILASNQVERLTVPVKYANKGLPIQVMELDQKVNWAKKHWRAIESAYRRAPFFEFYDRQIQQVLLKGHTSLFELNKEILGLLCQLLGVKCRIHYTEGYENNYAENFVDLRTKVDAKGEHHITNLQPYIQVFGEQFLPNLSILDLLFCEGPASKGILEKQYTSLLP
ncbi:WbqC family protein [Algivirga pacifica]|uniref:WbqC family protein n=1 Tax=Algivirga pacifica TaxID=1162670 RepID=A0ABP9DMY2_9BACT